MNTAIHTVVKYENDITKRSYLPPIAFDICYKSGRVRSLTPRAERLPKSFIDFLDNATEVYKKTGDGSTVTYYRIV